MRGKKREEKDEERDILLVEEKRAKHLRRGNYIWGGYGGAYSRNTSKALPCYADKNLQPIEGQTENFLGGLALDGWVCPDGQRPDAVTSRRTDGGLFSKE